MIHRVQYEAFVKRPLNDERVFPKGAVGGVNEQFGGQGAEKA